MLPKLPNFHEKPEIRVLMGNLSEEMRKKTFLVRGQCWQWLGAGKALRVEGVRASLGCQSKAGGVRRVRRARALQPLPGADWEGPRPESDQLLGGRKGLPGSEFCWAGRVLHAMSEATCHLH